MYLQKDNIYKIKSLKNKMKRGLNLSIIIMFLFSIGLISSVGESCSITDRSACTGTIVIGLSDLTNAHGELAGEGNYNKVLCCNFAGSLTCDGTNKIIGLSSTTNAHAEITTETTYSNNICYGDLSCISTSLDCINTPNPLEIFSLSDFTNAQIGQIGDYGINICCSIEIILLQQVRWTNSLDETINTISIFVDTTSVKLVLENSGLSSGTVVNFDIFEDDLILDDFIRTITATVDINGKAVATWTITQADLDKTVDIDEFYFDVNGEKSDFLSITIIEGTCVSINFCRDYTNQDMCENDIDFCNVGAVSVNENSPTPINCDEEGIECGCSFDSTLTENQCNPEFTVLVLDPSGDLDGDGIPDINDTDVDGDGILNGNDPDIDGDGVVDQFGSVIGNGLGDIDGDGLLDINDGDIDGDGILNGDELDDASVITPDVATDTDIDGDGIPDISDPDIDGDGILNGNDPDANGDGVVDFDKWESVIGNGQGDLDGDGLLDINDGDIDGDGILNGNELSDLLVVTPDVEVDDNDVDGDGILNGNDPDIDGDGVVDQFGSVIGNGLGDIDGDGLLDINDGDIDGDGILNGDDPDVGGDGVVDQFADVICNNLGDFDCDGILNGDDPDADGDGFMDEGFITIDPNGDDDGDGILNINDPDIDGDGILNGDDPDINGDSVIDQFKGVIGIGIEIGTCSYQETTNDNCDDGFLSYSWTSTWSGNEENRPIECVDGSKTIECPAQIQLPFFGVYNFIVTLLIIAFMYIILVLIGKKFD